jgi:Bacterial extracellular solute-binding protein
VISKLTAVVKRCAGSVVGILRAIVLAITVASVLSPAFAQTTPAKSLAVIPPNKDTNLKFYRADGIIVNGAPALEHISSDANLVLWVAGNQFFAMDEVVGAFQKAHPGVTVGLITLPPGLILSAILGGGWIYNGKEYRGTPDIYASVNLGHLRQLKTAGLMSNYEIYMHRGAYTQAHRLNVASKTEVPNGSKAVRRSLRLAADTDQLRYQQNRPPSDWHPFRKWH